MWGCYEKRLPDSNIHYEGHSAAFGRNQSCFSTTKVTKEKHKMHYLRVLRVLRGEKVSKKTKFCMFVVRRNRSYCNHKDPNFTFALTFFANFVCFVVRYKGTTHCAEYAA